MGQALLTKGCTKDLLERLKVVYELAGFPGKAVVEKSGRGTCTEHKSASCSIPRGQGEVAYGKAWLCTGLLHCSQQHGRILALQQASPRGGLFWFIVGIPQLCLPGAAFPVLPSAGAAWGCCSLPCRCPRLGWGVQVPCPVLWLHTTQGSLAPIPGTCNGRGEMLLLLQGP